MPNKVYETIMDPDLTLAYVAATLKTSIDAYRAIAGFDISEIPGITATLYNIGNPEARAYALKDENKERARRGEQPRCPRKTTTAGWSTRSCRSCRRCSDPRPTLRGPPRQETAPARWVAHHTPTASQIEVTLC